GCVDQREADQDRPGQAGADQGRGDRDVRGRGSTGLLPSERGAGAMITALFVSVLLLVGNAFFVAAEFALVASKRHRLEDLAERGSIAAEAAVRGSRELSLMLAGAQLGITLCTLGLGSLAKPAVAELLQPVLAIVRLPDAAAYVISVLLAVAL